VAEDPEHFQYWYPLIGSMVNLYLNTAKAPFDDIELRKAISMGIDRQQLATVAVYDYTAPSDATGMSDLFEQWKDQDVIEDGADLVSHSLDAANALLDDAGYEFNGDVRMAPDGTQ